MTENRSKGPEYITPQGEKDRHYNGLTPAQQERLVMLAEECTEVAHAVTKILRHGYDSCNPFSQDCETNQEHLFRELNDLAAVITMITLDIPQMEDADECDRQVEAAFRKKLEFAHHQADDFKGYIDAVNSL